MSSFSSFFSGGGADNLHPAVRGNIVTGSFGTGQNVQWFVANGTFVVPPNITAVRVRLWGGGSVGGGGFAIKVVSGLTPGASIAVTVGAATTPNVTGGTSSFGAHVSATGGAATGTTNPAGGTGVGGDFNSTGGEGLSSTGNLAGGGAAGIFGNGGGYQNNGNAGGGSASSERPGASGISGKGGGIRGTGTTAFAQTNGDPGYLDSLDFIATGGGGGHLGGGANGGGGGSSSGSGGFPGGGASGQPASGAVIVEW